MPPGNSAYPYLDSSKSSKDLSQSPTRLKTPPHPSARQPSVSSYAGSIDLQSILGKSYSPKSPKTTTTTRSPESTRRSLPRSNSSSNGIKDGLGNLNRWSQSTSSSKESHSHSHNRSASFSRRISFGGPGGFRFGSDASRSAKLDDSKGAHRPESSTGLRLSTSTSSKPSLSLPPIITLPALDASHESVSSPLTGASTSVTPSTAGLISAAARATIPDYFGKVWDGPESQQAGQLDLPLQTPADVERRPSGSVPLSLFANPVKSSHTEGALGHSRNRSVAGKSSSGTHVSDVSEGSRGKERGNKPPSQKAMLSKALQKANTAVLLDNAQNFEGAIQAYSEACNLLQQVMMRSSGMEDKRKLEAIRNTYSSRIKELEKIAPRLTDGKELPARPESKPDSVTSSHLSSQPTSPRSMDPRSSAIVETATVARIVNDISYNPNTDHPRQLLPHQLPKRRESLGQVSYIPEPHGQRPLPQRAHGKQSLPENLLGGRSLSAMESDYMPPPLSPRRLPQDGQQAPHPSDGGLYALEDVSNVRLRPHQPMGSHSRNPSTDSMSWLDTIDESVGSRASSVHSRTSSLRVVRKHIRAPSGATEAEFDAALDAAVEAAYDEGLEPDDPFHPPIIEDYDNEVVLNARRRVELAKERVRQTELETERETVIQLARERERMRIFQDDRDRIQAGNDEDNESDEEERMLEEMTRGYVMDEFEFDLESKSALPRESDSSSFSGRTWNSSIGSNPTTAGMTDKTVSPDKAQPGVNLPPPPLTHPPPSQTLPLPPTGSTIPPRTNSAQSVRNRRLSGQNLKQLKIETISRPPTLPPSMPLPRAPNGSISSLHGIPTQTVSPIPPGSIGPMPHPAASDAPQSTLPPLPRSVAGSAHQSEVAGYSMERPLSQATLRKNQSSASLRNMKARNLSVSIPEIEPESPVHNDFGASPATREPESRLPTMPTLPTPMATAFKDRMNGVSATGDMFLLNNDLSSPDLGNTSAGPSISGGPIPLEPCPKECLLRPFWLMRALYQTIAHPRGGYLSTKLFIPRDVWRVKGVKIKGLEDKVAILDFLTAALQKLAKVDTNDADLVLDEMQSLESILEQVQATLTKKLGTEVGVQASGTMFKDAEISPSDIPTSGSKTPGASGKSAFSWRRLRSKNSGVGLSANYNAKAAGTSLNVDLQKDNNTMATLPMTSLATIRFVRRDISQIQLSGPNAAYMGSLARLFDAAQVIDQIARQVEDPGLRHADKTQVGLELSTRHAAEFFGFYICRFVLGDVGILLDKFIKRGSEWVVL